MAQHELEHAWPGLEGDLETSGHRHLESAGDVMPPK